MDDTINSRLARLRASAWLNATDLGRIAGLESPQHVGMIERGTRTHVTATTAVALSRALGTPTEYLVEGVGEEPSPELIRAAVRSRCEEILRHHPAEHARSKSALRVLSHHAARAAASAHTASDFSVPPLDEEDDEPSGTVLVREGFDQTGTG